MPLSKDTIALDVLEATNAAYDRGFAAARKKVEAAAESYDSQRDRANWQDPFRKGKTAGFVAALAALTDTEGRDE